MSNDQFKTLTRVIDGNGNECLYVGDERASRESDFTVYFADLIEHCGSAPVYLKSLKLNDKHSDSLSKAGFGFAWPATLGELQEAAGIRRE